MSSALVQQAPAVSSSVTVTLTLTLPGNATIGNVAVVEVGASNTSNLLCDLPTGLGVGTWFRLGSSNGGAASHGDIFAGVIGSATTQVTVTHPVAHSFRANLTEWSGLTLTGATGTGFYNTPGTLNPITATLNPTQSVGAVFFTFGAAVAGNLSAPTNTFTALLTANGAQAQAYRQVANTSGTYASGWSDSASSVSDTVIAVIYETAAGGPTKFLPEALGLHALGGLH